MTKTHLFSALFVTAALCLPAAPALANKAKAPAKPVLTCKVTTPEGLSYTVIKAGKGDKPATDARVVVNYSGRLASDGKEFDSGKEAKFKANQLIPGFTQGLLMMQPGAKYRFCIPSKLGYGEAGAGENIPANADLVFEVDLLSFTNPPPKPVVPVADRVCAQTTASGLGFTMVKPGSGTTATDKDMVLIDYATFDPKTGVINEQQLWEKIPMGQVTPVFGEALKLMPPGSSYRFCLPPRDPAEAANPDAERVNLIVDMLGVRAAPVVED
jgi:FKBP-type peptidyl-prolyl cis-trans isomerase